LANLNFCDSHDEIESSDIIIHTVYAYSHFSLVAAGSQKMEMHKVTAVSVVMYSKVDLFGTPHIDRVGTTGRSFLCKSIMPSMI